MFFETAYEQSQDTQKSTPVYQVHNAKKGEILKTEIFLDYQ